MAYNILMQLLKLSLLSSILVVGMLDAAAAKSLQSCPTLCDPVDGSLPGSPVPGILQARTLEWVAISFSNEWKWKVKVKLLSHVRLFTTPWTAAYQAPPSMGFSRQEYWSGVPLPSPVGMLKPPQHITQFKATSVNFSFELIHFCLFIICFCVCWNQPCSCFMAFIILQDYLDKVVIGNTF